MQISRGIAPSPRLQLLRFSSVKEHKPDKDGNISAIESELPLCIKLKGNHKCHDEDDGGPLYPRKGKPLRFLRGKKWMARVVL